jgi:hypothetical protein
VECALRRALRQGAQERPLHRLSTVAHNGLADDPEEKLTNEPIQTIERTASGESGMDSPVGFGNSYPIVTHSFLVAWLHIASSDDLLN